MDELDMSSIQFGRQRSPHLVYSVSKVVTDAIWALALDKSLSIHRSA